MVINIFIFKIIIINIYYNCICIRNYLFYHLVFIMIVFVYINIYLSIKYWIFRIKYSEYIIKFKIN